MAWDVVFHDQFALEFDGLQTGVQDELLAHAVLLRDYGPGLGRPTVDTLKGSQHANMKEMRFGHGKAVWRVAFAFDPLRRAVLLVAGNKVGADQRLFYKRLIDTADQRMAQHLSEIKTVSTVLKENPRGKKT
jgi:hypothetical protein